MVKEKIVTSQSKILYTQLGMPQKYREVLIEEAHRLKNRKNRENNEKFSKIFKENDYSKVIGSSYKLWEESTLFDTLLDNILKFIYLKAPAGYTYGLGDTWLGIYDKGQESLRHSHEPYYISFCYYISAKEPFTPMVFNDTEINAITDRLIMFPSYLYHSVPPSKGGERIMIAGNISAVIDV